MSAPRKEFAWIFTLEEDAPALDARTGDTLFLYLNGEVAVHRELSAHDVAAAVAADVSVAYGLADHSSARIRLAVPGKDLRAGDEIFALDGGVILSRMLNHAPARRAAWRAARRLRGSISLNVSAHEAGYTAAQVRAEWEAAYCPVRLVADPAKERRTRGHSCRRGAASPYYVNRPVPALAVIRGGAA